MTKDADYEDLSLLRGWPPKVVRIVSGNGPNEPVAISLLARKAVLEAFDISLSQGVFILE